MSGFEERGTSEPTLPGECTESEMHYRVCGPCAVEAGEMHRTAAEVQGMVENAWDLLDMALKDEPQMLAKPFTLVASVQHILDLAKNRLNLEIVSETISPEGASKIQAELKERFEGRPKLTSVEPLD